MSDSVLSPNFSQKDKAPIEQYRLILKEIIGKIQKTVPSKKYKELIELCRQAIEQVDQDKESCADKYFYILKMGLETGLPRLMTDILSSIQRLYSYEFLIGDCEDNCLYAEDRKPSSKNGRLPRLLIDAIVESVCECAQDSDNQVQLQVIKALLTLVIAVNSKVHESTLLVALKTQYSIFMTSTSQTNQKTAKAASTQMVVTVFSRMDVYSKHGGNLHPLDLRKVEGRLSSTLEKSLQKRKEESKDEVSQTTQQTVEAIRKSQPLEVTFSQTDQYLHGLLKNMVDNVCLHEARVNETIRLHFLNENVNLQQDGTQMTTEGIQAQLIERISKIPLNPIPSGKKDCPEVVVKNELGFDAGRFGWCIQCRSTANLYCKDTLHPVCSDECKRRHMVEASSLDRQQDNTVNFTKSSEAKLALTDAHLVFRSIVKLSIGDGQNTQVNRFAMRTKIIGLELILTVLSSPKQALLQKKEFLDVIKNTLCDGLLRYSVSTELVIFELVIEIFYCLFLHFRKHLKQIIRVFIENIFLKLLDSGNSSYQHKNLILSVFDKISRNTGMLLEIFVNYDCDISQKDLTERIVESICKIANNHFAKSEHQNIISPTEATQLKNYAIQILVQMLRSFNSTIDAQIAESKISERMLSRKGTATEENLSDSNPTISEATETIQILDLQNQTSAGEKKQMGYQLGEIQSQRNVKQEMAKAALKFNFKAKNGINYLVQQKLIAPSSDFDQHVKDIVKFLKTNTVLDKTMIGQFLGVDEKLQKACLYQFIDEFNLKGVDYVQSLKTILQGFRLPGEGQVVDRVMEKFGLKFIEDNPNGTDGCQGVMTAECVYLLSYATMMMQTSLHNPNAVKSRMTLEDFSKMIKGINASENLQPEFVKKIYDTVEREPFTLNEDDDARLKAEAATATTFKRKQELFQKEGMSLIDRSKSQIAGVQNQTYITVDEAGPIKPLFENTWSAFIAIFSMLLEKTNEDHIANLCIEGFSLSIKISGFFNLKTERDAFVSSFAKFTLVTSERKLQQKNIVCIMSLLDLATFQGNYLGESWFFVLECVSRIEEMINLGSGQIHDRDFFDTQTSHRVPNKNVVHSATGQKSAKELVLAANSELIVQSISIERLDQIFQNSLNLDQDAIIYFIESLCANSKNELKDQSNPRKFSLQALVEIADLNMARIRFVWAKLWEMLSKHFIWVGSHQNLMVAIFAIDSLRQLADKFLKKEDFMSFNFQKDFLKPFESIMLNNMHTRGDIKDYIVTCITSICATKTTYIKSGWSVIINIFTLAAQDTEKQLVIQSFAALKQAILKHFDLLQQNFVELVNCLNKYSLNLQFQYQAEEALDLLLVCAEKLQDKTLIDWFVQKNGLQLYQESQENMQRYQPQYGITANQESEKIKNPIAGSVVINTQKESTDQEASPSDDQIRLAVLKALWFPIMHSLTNIILERNQQRQDKAMIILLQVLEKAIPKSSTLFWRELISQVLYPILEDIHLAVETQRSHENEEENIFYQQIFEKILEEFGGFLKDNYEQLPQVIPIYADIICLFISNTQNKRIAQVVVTVFNKFVQTIGHKISINEWDSLTTSVCLCFDATQPKDLLAEHPENLQSLFTKCLVQLFMINCVKEMVSTYYAKISAGNIRQLLSCLEVSHSFSQEFNRNIEVRLKLWEQGFMKEMKNLPGLIAQEYKSLAAIIQIRFILYFREQHQDDDQHLIKLCNQVLSEYQVKSREYLIVKQVSSETVNIKEDELKHLHEDELERQLSNLTPIVSQQILENLAKLQDQQLKKNIKEMCPILIDLTLCPDQQVRVANKNLLTKMFNMLI